MGLELVFASLAAGGTIGSTLTAVYGAIGAAAIRIGASVLLSQAAGAIFRRKPQQQDLKRDLGFPTSRPAYRFPYGMCRMAATPLPYPVVGEFAYACYLISSRPSEGQFTVILDDREVLVSGDPYDFSGDGAVGTEFPFEDHLNVFIGLGDQSQPPQMFLDEAGYVENGDELLWKPTDRGEGCTIVWVRFRAGDNGNRSERWPNAVPSLELEGKFAKVWDPRDAAQDFEDPTTWLWSENAALCALDLHTQNLFRPYELRNISLGMWEDYADQADEVYLLKSGGSEAQFTTSGVVVFDGSELEQLLAPVLACGGARLTSDGGQRGVVPAVARQSAVTISDALEGLTFSALVDDSSLVTELRVNYSPLERGGEPAELRPWSIPGALEQDGGQPSVKTLDFSMVRSATQAQRLRNITGKVSRLQRSLKITAPPSAMKAVAGSVVNINLIDPYGAKVNRLYEVEGMGAAVNIISEDGLELRIPMSLREYADASFDWDRFVDEEDVIHVPYDSQRDGVAPPGSLSVQSGDGIDLDSGGAIIPRFLFQADPSTSASAENYEWEWRLSGEQWQTGGVVSGALNADGKVQFYLPVASFEAGHDVQLRTLGTTGRSDWVRLEGAFYALALTGVTAVAETGAATFSGGAPNSTVFAGVQIFRSEVGQPFSDAVPVMDAQAIEAGAPFSVLAGAQGVNVVVNGDFAAASDWTYGTNWAHNSDRATHTAGSFGKLSQVVSLDVGETYRVGYTLLDDADPVSNGARFRVEEAGATSNFTDPHGTFQADNGVYPATMTAVAGQDTLTIRAGGGWSGSVDDIYMVKETPEMLPFGPADFWVVPVTLTGAIGQPTPAITLNIT